MDQRRPALGRRPWLALERRARNLRRVFFAMRDARVVRARLRAHGWVSPPVVVARSRWQRWRGLRTKAGCRGLLLAGSRVHGRGMAEAIRLVGIDVNGVVLSSTVLVPGRFSHLDGARYVLELPLGAATPTPGAELVIEPIVAR